jgi:hypothetical protein
VRTLLCLVAILGLACSQRAKAPPVSWDTQASVLAAGRNALYSWRFHEGGVARYTVALHAPTQKQACESHSQLGEDLSSDYWYMDLDFGDSVAGTYQVGAVGVDAGARSVEAPLLHREGGSFREDYEAVAGEVTIAAAPSFADFRAGVGLSLQGWLSWPALPRTTVMCSGTFPVDGGIAAGQASCVCKDPLGVQSTCETVPPEDCCRKAAAGDLLTFEIPATEAKPCVGMCRYAVGVPDLCSQELGGPGRDGSVETGLAPVICRGTDCERKGWPQVAVRFASNQIAQGDVFFIVPDGRAFSGDSQGGCPMWPPQIPAELSCDVGIIMGEGDTKVGVRVAPAGLVAAEAAVEVAPKNYCAANIAYITASVAEGAVSISAPEYRSPCAELGL